MKIRDLEIDGNTISIVEYTAAVVGTGAAGYAAAMYLFERGMKDTVVVTEGVNCGTSRNTGSDKQTYYKLGLAGEVGDCPAEMARDLFSGGSVDGDIALAEAANSVGCFMKLVSLGVRFPVNRYGEYIGYKTDHDSRARATSAGPLTSKEMTEALQNCVEALGISIMDEMLVIEVLKEKEGVAGLLLLNKRETESCSFVLLKCANIIFATGGPSGIYADSVYPICHTGGSGVLLSAGLWARNLTEWQFGLASVSPRWNVSGTYMQVLPRFVSIDAKGNGHYFLEEQLEKSECLNKTFLKGYEWPFDSRKINASSAIDLLVYREKALGRRVYLDFREDPYGKVDYSLLNKEAGGYLRAAQVCFGTPVERLKYMNRPAYDLYLSKGINLDREQLEISLCVQHCNGGIAVDVWWQSSLKGLFVIGEAAGTHGVYRPGGSALNAGQVGAFRAASYIAQYPRIVLKDCFYTAAAKAVRENMSLIKNVFHKKENVRELDKKLKEEMSLIAGAVRKREEMEVALSRSKELLADFKKRVSIENFSEIVSLYKFKNNLECRIVVLEAMLDFYYHTGGKTRGSALYVHRTGTAPMGMEELKFIEGENFIDEIQEISMNGIAWRKVRPIPETGGFFENIWKSYRKNNNVF